MKVKNRDLRRRQPQLPINYPAPDVIPFDYEREKVRIENICKRLADNEVDVRDAVLAEVPRLIKEICQGFSEEHAAAAVAMCGLAPEDGEAAAASAARVEALDPEVKATLRSVIITFDKLWLGLFFCMWHSDKPLVQLDCAAAMSLLLSVPPTASHRIIFIRSHFRIFAKQWLKIDQWRLDKYLALERKIIFEIIRMTAQYDDASAADDAAKDAAAAAAAGEDSPVAALGTIVPQADRFLQSIAIIFRKECVMGSVTGLTMHVCDVLLPELLKCEGASPALVLQFIDRLALFAMSKGDGVEKRVLDNILSPAAAGALEKRFDGDDSARIALGLADVCRAHSVSKATGFSIRPLFVEGQRVLEMYVERLQSPESFERTTKRDKESRIRKEVAQAEATKVRLMGVVNSIHEKKKRFAKKQAAASGKKKPAKRVSRRKK